MNSVSGQRRAALALRYAILVGLVALLLAPLCYLLATALASPGVGMRISDNPLALLWPAEWRWENFAEVWRVIPFSRYYANSLFVALAITAGQTLTSACAAFAFARLEWPGRDKIFLCYLATLMVPGAVTMLPNFVLMKMLPDAMAGLAPVLDWRAMRYVGSGEHAVEVGRLVGLDSYFALIAPGMFSAYGTFMLRQYFLTIPRQIDEAAKIDGCGYWRLFRSILLPLATPGLATLAIFTFVGAWSSFLWPLVVLSRDDLRTLPLALPIFQSQYGAEWHLLMAAALLMLLPSLLVFLFGQRYFVHGLAVGAVKG